MKTQFALVLALICLIFGGSAAIADNFNDLKAAAEKGNAQAQFGLGMIFEQGDGMPKNQAEAVKWFRKAADQGQADAQFCLGCIYKEGVEGFPKDGAEAVKWFRKAAEQGFNPAKRELGIAYAKGLGGTQDLIQAHVWTNLTNKGQPGRTGNLITEIEAKMTPGQIAEATKLADELDAQIKKESAEAAVKSAEAAVKDIDEAVKRYRKAAEQGDANAQFRLGVCYYKGEGVITDLPQAHAWINLASAGGAEDGKEVLNGLESEMTPAQIAKATKLAREIDAKIKSAKDTKK